MKSKKDSKFISLVSSIAVLGIALGVIVLNISLTVLDGFESTVTQKIVDINAHIKISSFRNLNLPGYKKEIPKITGLIGRSFESISPFVTKFAIIKTKLISEGIQVTGTDKSLDNSSIRKYIINGEFDFATGSTKYGIVIGKKLADKLQVGINDKISLLALKNDEIPSFTNPPAIEQFIVTGIYESGMSQYDDLNVYIDLEIAQDFFGIGEKVSGYNIKLNNTSVIDSLESVLQNNLRYPYYVRSVFKVHQNIFTWIDLQKEPIPIVLGIIIIVAVFNIIGMLLMIVLEKTESIGILKSLGANKATISTIFTLQGLYLSFIGIIIGNSISIIFSILQNNFNLISLPSSVYFISSVPISINWINYFIVSVSTILLSVLAAYIPSKIAANTKIISAIRFE
ncbi:MAG: ABC transporter permease [Ignavibacteria bacterium]